MASDEHAHAILYFGSHLLLLEWLYPRSSSSLYLCLAHFSIFPLDISMGMSHRCLRCNMLKVNSPFPMVSKLIFFFLLFLIIPKDIAIYLVKQVRNLGAIFGFLYFLLFPQLSPQVLLILSLILLKCTPSHHLHLHYLFSL